MVKSLLNAPAGDVHGLEVVKVIDFKPLPLTALGTNTTRHIGFFHVKKLSSELMERQCFYSVPICAINNARRST
jgi:hypothetical protein